MKLGFFGDTHTQHKWVELREPVDYLIFSGDGEFRNLGDIHSFNDWIGKLKKQGDIKVECLITSGNHDSYPQSKLKETKLTFTNGVYLQDEEYILNNGMKVWMSPWSVRFMDWWFMASEEDLETKYYSKIPRDTNILITHTPPYKILDYDTRNGYLGSKSLSKKIDELKELKIHAFGHIHRDEEQRRQIIEGSNNVMFINCGLLDNWYNMVHDPIVVEV